MVSIHCEHVTKSAQHSIKPGEAITHILSLDHDTSILLHIRRIGEMLLASLDRDRAVLARALVELNALLVGL